MSTLKAINVVHPSGSTTNIVNDASGNITVGNNATVTGTLTVAGVAAVAVAPGTSGNVLTSTGSAWASSAPAIVAPTAIGQVPFSTNGTSYTATQKITQGTVVATTSGTSIDFTSIPSWVKRITVMFQGVSTSGTSIPQVQIGAGSVTTSGYVGSAASVSASPVIASATTGFIFVGQGNAANVISGILTLASMGSNLWVASVSGSISTIIALCGGGNITLSGALDRVRITTVNGTDTFDAGSVNIMYE